MLTSCGLYTYVGVDGDRSVLVYRLHHALTDGQGSIRALLSVTSLDEDLTKKQYSAGYVSPYTNLTRRISNAQWLYGVVLYVLLDALAD